MPIPRSYTWKAFIICISHFQIVANENKNDEPEKELFKYG